MERIDKYDILVVGLGGTGSKLIGNLAQFAAYDTKKRIGKIVLCDGDVIEEKNCQRQNFGLRQAGQAKVAALQHMLKVNYPDLKVEAYAEYLTDEGRIREVFDTYKIPVLISCVDNNGARLLFEKWFYNSSTRDAVYLDSGNGYTDGQTCIALKRGGQVISPCLSYYNSGLKDGDTRNITEMSCAELNQSEPQHIAVNVKAASCLFDVVTGLCEGVADTAFIEFDCRTCTESRRTIADVQKSARFKELFAPKPKAKPKKATTAKKGSGKAKARKAAA